MDMLQQWSGTPMLPVGKLHPSIPALPWTGGNLLGRLELAWPNDFNPPNTGHTIRRVPYQTNSREFPVCSSGNPLITSEGRHEHEKCWFCIAMFFLDDSLEWSSVANPQKACCRSGLVQVSINGFFRFLKQVVIYCSRVIWSLPIKRTRIINPLNQDPNSIF